MNATTASATEFLEDFARAWADNDGAAIGHLFTVDGSLVNPFGERADGRAAVAEMYSQYFSGLLAGTTTIVTEVVSDPIADGAVFVDAEQVISGPDGMPIMTVHLVALLAREGQEWRFAHSRPYLPASPAGL